MSGIAAKLAFVHRRLWQRDGTYRAAVVLGPPPLLGCALAVALWAGIHAQHPRANSAHLPPWASWDGPRPLDAAGPPHVVQPNIALPPIGSDGLPAGFESGWQMRILEMQLSDSLDANVLDMPLDKFTSDQLAIDMARIMATEPPVKLYAGSFDGFLVVRQTGIYGLTVHVERPSELSAMCTERLAVKDQRLVSKLDLTLNSSNPHTYDPVKLDMQPGLYFIGGLLSCWRGQQVVGPARLTVMISHPGDRDLQLVGPTDIVRPKPMAITR